MNWNRWIRQAHRWLSITFTVAVIVNIALNVLAPAQQALVMWVGLLTLIPLTLLLITGLCLLVLPYTTRKTDAQRADA